MRTNRLLVAEIYLSAVVLLNELQRLFNRGIAVCSTHHLTRAHSCHECCLCRCRSKRRRMNFCSHHCLNDVCILVRTAPTRTHKRLRCRRRSWHVRSIHTSTISVVTKSFRYLCDVGICRPVS